MNPQAAPTANSVASTYRLFLSVDVVGSTAYKQKMVSAQVPGWFPFFRDFYEEFPVYFRNACTENLKTDGRFPLPEYARGCEPRVWKSLGDELLFYADIVHHVQAELFVTSFRQALERYMANMGGSTRLKLKACAWTASFPVRNTELRFMGQLDFIGPQVDIGFRLARFANSSRIIISCELALLLLHRTNSLQFHYAGKRELKGMLGDEGYPLIWLPVDDHNQSALERELFREVSEQNLQEFCRDCIQTTGLPMELPYLPEDEAFNKKPLNYQEELQQVRRLHEQEDSIEALESNSDNRQQPAKTKDRSPVNDPDR